MKTQLRVLVVEDSEADTALLVRELTRGGYEPVIERVEAPEALKAALETRSWDLVVADYSMPRFNSTAALKMVQQTGLDIPFIIVSGTIGEDRAVSAMKAGAHDYILKGNLTRLLPAIARELREAEERRERKRAEARLHELAYYDVLSGLPNRRFFLELLNQALLRAQRTHLQVALLFLDLDRFKLVNDTLGHPVGDELLRAVAKRLKNSLRAGDTVARLGGDEFTIIVEDITSPDDIAGLAQKMLNALTPTFTLEGQDVFITASIGIALYPGDGTDGNSLLRNADAAMYACKEQGGNFRFYSPSMNAATLERLAVETGLRRAMERQEFVLHYQPVVEFSTGTILGLEALIRWQHQDRGLLYPDTFIPVAEGAGIINAIGEWVLRTACAQMKAWQANGFPLRSVSVNLSPKQLHRPDLVDMVARVLQETGVAPDCLVLELTEKLLIQNIEQTGLPLRTLREMGVQLAIDDFGAEYSSLGYLRRLPISVLKIDRSFVQDITTNSDAASIATMIITLAHSLNLRVTAEGVETLEQAKVLYARRCDLMQGDYFSRPLPADKLTALLATRTSP